MVPSKLTWSPHAEPHRNKSEGKRSGHRPTTPRYAGRDMAKAPEPCRLLKHWADSHGLVDRWMWDAAVQTLSALAESKEHRRWHYMVEELDSPVFDLTFGSQWIPGLTPWS